MTEQERIEFLKKLAEMASSREQREQFDEEAYERTNDYMGAYHQGNAISCQYQRG